VLSPLPMVEALRLRADVATIPFSVIGKLIQHPLTDLGLARFLKDAAAIPKD
jgi:transaldolase